MIVTKISPEFTVVIPDEYRKQFSPDDQVAVTVDSQGRLVITHIEQIRELLMETFGMWADRTDIPTDGVAFMDEIRRGTRLDELGIEWNENN
ncbi:MAG: hypothetical protein BroJett039_01840 [Chloroflexota bacterium]|nr:MAG: hypothetical protein BroJett039_01840 [Chloroflexota bacterium]